MRRRGLVIGGGALIVVIVLVAVGGYLYFFSGLRQSPDAPAVSGPSPGASGGAVSGSDLAGKWSVQSGSLVGYRVHEQFVGQSSTHEAVARTSNVNGGLTIQQAGSSLQATGITVTARLADLKSVDTVAGRDVANRDRIVNQALSTAQYPDATFTASSVAIPAAALQGQPVSLTVPGQLTVHGTTKTVQASLQGSASAGQLQLAGTVPVTMTDFGVQPPQLPFVSVPTAVTVELALKYAKSGA